MYSLDGSYVWVREYKDTSAEFDMSAPQRMGTAAISFSRGIHQDGRWFHSLDAPVGINAIFNPGLGSADENVYDILQMLGRALYDFEPVNGTRETGSWPAVASFLLGRGSSFDSIQGIDKVRSELFDAVTSEWLAELSDWFQGGAALHSSHGEFSMANISLTPRGLVVLTDPSQIIAPRGFDVGWLIGDFVELALSPFSAFSSNDAAVAAEILLREYLDAASKSAIGALPIRFIAMAAQLRLIYHYIEYRIHPEVDQTNAAASLALIATELPLLGGPVLGKVLQGVRADD